MIKLPPWIIVSPRLCRALSFVVDIAAITLWPFILFAREPDPVTENHERIHFRQQWELFVVGFYAIYVWEWFWRKRKLERSRESGDGSSSEKTGQDGVEAYEDLRFEQEAYAHETDPFYLKNRKFLAWRAIPLT